MHTLEHRITNDIFRVYDELIVAFAVEICVNENLNRIIFPDFVISIYRVGYDLIHVRFIAAYGKIDVFVVVSDFCFRKLTYFPVLVDSEVVYRICRIPD